MLPRFFDLLAVGRTVTPGGDLGLSPALAERIISLHGDRVSIGNLTPPGIRMVARFVGPKAGPR